MNRVKLRRELKELLPHLAEMSGNEVKLCLLLDLKGGCAEESPDDLARLCGWSLSTLKRTARELKAKSHIEVEGVRRYSNAAVRVRVKSGPASDGVKADTAKAGVKSDPRESVPDTPPGVKDDPIEEGVPLIAVEIPASCRFAGELSAVSQALLEFIGFAYDRRFLSRGFVVLLEKFSKLRPWPRPGVLASKLIERCLHWQRKRKSEGKGPLLYAWPPGFQKHTADLRNAERESGRREREMARAAA